MNVNAKLLRLGASTFSFMWSEGALQSLRRMRALRLNDFDVILAPGHLWHRELTAAQRSALRAALQAEDIRIESLNLPALDCNLASAIPEIRATSAAMYEDVFALAGDLGVRSVVAVPGRISGLLPPAQDDSINWLSESVGRLLAAAERHDQTIYLETHPQTPIPTAALMSAFVDRFRHRRLLVAYDVANAEFLGEEQGAALRKLGARLGQIHLSDATRTSWRHDRIGSGSVDFGVVIAALEDVGFEGVSVLEIISAQPIDDMAASLKALSAR